MERQDSNMTAIASEHEHKHEQELEPAVPIVTYLGPRSSYTHQVFSFREFITPAWSIGLTDYDLAQTALQCFEADKYDYRPAITIPGYILNPQYLTSGLQSNLKLF
jgi:hypothetical protein